MPNTFHIDYTLNELNAVAEDVLRAAGTVRCFVFDAPMGAGKTTFIRSMCMQLGAIDTVNSPTFAIINHYKTTANINLYHMDWYRLRHEEDAIEAGVEECLHEADAYCFIEWPERAEALLPKPYWRIQIEVLNENTRRLIRTLVV